MGLSGTRLGRYEVVKHLADGGMAEVLLARVAGSESSEHVVLKRIRGEQKHDRRFVTMFLDEARLAVALDHPHVVRVHDIGQEGSEFFFAMEYVHGEDARRLLTELNRKQQRLPLEHVLTIAIAALDGLHYAHEHELQIVHRDVSPANILIGYDGGVKVADFGIAKAALRTQETRSGTLKGKVSYMSPEQCTGGTVDRRSDVFAMGIVLYELCTVRRLFKGENDFMTMTAIVQGGVPPPRTVRPDLSPELEAIILKALALSPDRRYQSAAEMRGALAQFATANGLETSAPALGAFMKAQLGNRVEPWFADETTGPVEEMSIDFDGDGAGIASTNASLQLGDVRPSSPIAIARAPEEVAAERAPHEGWTVAPTASRTPIAWSREGNEPSRRRGWLIGAVAGVAAAAVLLIVVIVRSGGPEAIEPAVIPSPPQAPAPVSAAPSPAPEPAAPAPAPPPEPPTPEPEPEPVPVLEPEPPATAAIVPAVGSGSAKPSRTKRPRVKRPAPKSTPKWDPTTLFPKKR